MKVGCHADVAVGDHADHTLGPIARRDGQASAVVIPHHLGGFAESVARLAALRGLGHELLDSHRVSSSSP